MLNFAGTIVKLIFQALHEDRTVKFARTIVAPIFLIVTAGVLQVEAKELVVRPQDIHVIYDARHEFHTNSFLSAIKKKMDKISKSYDQDVLLRAPLNVNVQTIRCRQGDQICIRYEAWVLKQAEKILSIFERTSDLSFEIVVTDRQMRHHENNISQLENNIQKEKELQKKLYELQVFTDSLIRNKAISVEITTTLEQYMAESGNESMEMDERIADAKVWLQVNDADGLYKTFENFINQMETMYKNINTQNNLLLPHLYILFTNYNVDNLKNIFHFVTQMWVDADIRIEKLNRELQNEEDILYKLDEKYWRLRDEVDQIWAGIEHQSKKLVYPNRTYIPVDVCRRC